MKRVLIIGLGEIGRANASYLKSINGLDVYGFDINDQAVENARREGLIKPLEGGFEGFDVYMICVATHDWNDMTKPDLTPIHHTTRRILDEGTRGALVTMESTVPLGTSRHVGNLLSAKGIHLVTTPERYWKESKDHGINQARVMGSFDKCCRALGEEYYNQILQIPTYPASSLELAEASKFIENMERTVRIATVQGVRMYAESKGLSYEELKEACETKWNTEFLEARDGIFGHCLRKDTMMFVEDGGVSAMIAKAAIELDDLYREYRAPKNTLESTQ